MHGDATGDVVKPATESTVWEAELRELCYSWAGDFDAILGSTSATAALSPIRAIDRLGSSWEFADLRGRNSLLIMGPGELRRRLVLLTRDVHRHAGTRVVVKTGSGGPEESRLRSLGWRLVRRTLEGRPRYAEGTAPAVNLRASAFWALGEEFYAKGQAVDYEAAEAGMDPWDRVGGPAEPKSAKAARSYMEIPWERDRWDVGLPAEIDQIMAKAGVGIYPPVELGPSEVPFYKWVSEEGLLKSIQEADRAIAAGAMEYVPVSRMAEVSAVSTIHPWTIVDQGGGQMEALSRLLGGHQPHGTDGPVCVADGVGCGALGQVDLVFR